MRLAGKENFSFQQYVVKLADCAKTITPPPTTSPPTSLAPTTTTTDVGQSPAAAPTNEAAGPSSSSSLADGWNTVHCSGWTIDGG
eukprot:scaffold7696_cov141-Cylindrotheca_fusiformis.AAC.2